MPANTSKKPETEAQEPFNFKLAIFPPKKGYKWDIEDLLDCVYWLNHVISVVVGVAYGYLQVTGSAGIISYLAISSVLSLLYVGGYQNLDIEDNGGLTGIAKEGIMARFGLFMICWILTYWGRRKIFKKKIFEVQNSSPVFFYIFRTLSHTHFMPL